MKSTRYIINQVNPSRMTLITKRPGGPNLQTAEDLYYQAWKDYPGLERKDVSIVLDSTGFWGIEFRKPFTEDPLEANEELDETPLSPL